MSGNVGGVGEPGGIDPNQLEGVRDAEVEDRSAEVEARANALPGVDDLEIGFTEVEGDSGQGGDIPRHGSHDGEQRVLHTASGTGEMQGPDAQSGVGGSVVVSVSDAVGTEGVAPRTAHVERGELSADVQRDVDGEVTMTVDRAGEPHSRVRFQEVADDSVTIEVAPADGSADPAEVTIDVSETSDDDQAGFNKDDVDQVPDDKMAWYHMLEIVNIVMKNMEAWIAQGWEKGKPNI